MIGPLQAAALLPSVIYLTLRVLQTGADTHPALFRALWAAEAYGAVALTLTGR